MPVITKTVKETKSVGKSSSVGAVTFTFPSLAIPDGTKFYRYKVTNSNNAGSSVLQLQGSVGGVGWGNWDTHKSYIEWDGDDDKKANVSVRNLTQSSFNVTLTITFEFKVKPVSQGSIIKKYVRDALKESGSPYFDVYVFDESNTNSAVPVDALLDSKFSSGTIAKASTFNDKHNLE